MNQEERFAILARSLVEKALHDELVRFNENMMHYITESNRDILKAIEDLDRKLALLGIVPLVDLDPEADVPLSLWEGLPDSVRAGMRLVQDRTEGPDEAEGSEDPEDP